MACIVPMHVKPKFTYLLTGDTSSQNINTSDPNIVFAAWSELPPVRDNLCRTWTHTQIYTSILFHVYLNSIIKLALCNGYHAMFIFHIDMETSHKIDISLNSWSWNSSVVIYAYFWLRKQRSLFDRCVSFSNDTMKLWLGNAFCINDPLWAVSSGDQQISLTEGQ